MKEQKFYTTIADYYEEIFPVTESRISFIESFIQKGDRILDVGCATGSLTIALARKEGTVLTGIDYNLDMIEIARRNAKKKDVAVDFRQMDMRRLTNEFDPDSFDVILCLGNTLAHLSDRGDIKQYIKNSAEILKKGGLLVIQIVNFDRIIKQKIKELPGKETQKVEFYRYYEFLDADSTDGIPETDRKENQQLLFQTILKIKKSGSVLKNYTNLYPLQSHKIQDLLKAAEFRLLHMYGDFNRTEYSEESPGLLVVAEKKAYMRKNRNEHR